MKTKFIKIDVLENRHDFKQVQLLQLLQALDSDFDPPLSTLHDLNAFSEKLLARAILIAARRGNEVLGFVAVYCNDLVTRRAFVTFLGVLPRERGRGLGRRLMEEAIHACERRGMTAVELEVAISKKSVQAMYESIGFRKICSSGKAENKSSTNLRLDLKAYTRA